MSVEAATVTADMESSSRFVQTQRWRLHYHDVGTGYPVLLLHGTGPGATGWSNFHQNITGLAEHFRVITPDFPGWGQSDAFDCSKESRHTANALAIKLLMDELGIEKAALVGNSMGGGAALEFMASYPERVSHVVTMGAGLFTLPNMFSANGASEGLRVIFETYLNPSPENFRRLVSVMVFDQSYVTDALTQDRSSSALANREHLTNWMKAPMGNAGGPFGGLEGVMTKLVQSKTPTMMIHGHDDRVIPLETTLKTAALIPNSRAVILSRCGHWALVEHAAEFNALLTNFLRHHSVA